MMLDSECGHQAGQESVFPHPMEKKRLYLEAKIALFIKLLSAALVSGK